MMHFSGKCGFCTEDGGHSRASTGDHSVLEATRSQLPLQNVTAMSTSRHKAP